MIKFSNQHNFNFHYLYDKDQEIARNYNAVCTPDFFCFDNNKELFYRGRLDNLKYQSKNEISRIKELVNSIKLKIKENMIETLQHSSIGCSIKWKKNI